MSAKVPKVSKTSTLPAKAVTKVKDSKDSKDSRSEAIFTKASVVRLSEEDKKADSTNYIYNPNTDKYVKRDTPFGKKLVKAVKNGEEIPKTMTETERLILVVQTLVTNLNLEDSVVKTSLKPIVSDLPRGFPVVWGGKQKAVRLPDHPKQPTNSFIFFTKAVRESVVEANPELSNTQIIALMSKMWKETSEENRAEYNDLAAKDRERYEAEMKTFEAEHPDLVRTNKSTKTNKGSEQKKADDPEHFELDKEKNVSKPVEKEDDVDNIDNDEDILVE